MIRVLTANYNSTPYVHNLINSLQNQNYGNWKCYIYDDCSNDGSQTYIQDLIKDDKRFILKCNKKHFYPCGNHWQIMQRKEIKDNDMDIIVCVDGDDWLPLDDKEVFKRVVEYHKDSNIYMTFGQFEYYFGSNRESFMGFTKKPEPFKDIRSLPWSCSHLRTFKAHLFKHIKKESLIDPKTNNYFSMAGDCAIFTPLIELAGESRIKFVEDINYIYNCAGNLNEHTVNLQNQRKCYNNIMSGKPYETIK